MIEWFVCNMSILPIVQALIGFFIAVALVQSGLDKVMNRRDNLGWLNDHFSKTILRGIVPPMLTIITILELSGGLLSGIGTLVLLISQNNQYLIYGLIISAVNLLFLFFGQRIAKDYEGAAVLVGYFLLILLGLLTTIVQH